MPHTIVLGILGGICGALFLKLNISFNKIRKQYLTAKWMVPLEVMLFAFLTGLCFFWIPYLKNDCKYDFKGVHKGDEPFRAFCHEKVFELRDGTKIVAPVEK